MVIDVCLLKVQIDLKPSQRLLHLVPHSFHRQPQLIEDGRLVFFLSEDGVVAGLQRFRC